MKWIIEYKVDNKEYKDLKELNTLEEDDVKKWFFKNKENGLVSMASNRFNEGNVEYIRSYLKIFK